MELCLITNKADFASEAEQAGMDRIILDLERRGKAQRQAGRGLFLSDHLVEDVPKIRSVLKKASLVVRINPLDISSDERIDEVIEDGADFVMLPYFHTLEEVRKFIALVRGRARTILLVETKGAAEDLANIANEKGIDEMHLGLNDLSISLGYKIIFELICNGTIDNLSEIIKRKGIPFGFGGIARLSRKGLPVAPERILAEQVRLGASLGWLGRTFRGEMETKRCHGELAREIDLLRQAIVKWRSASEQEFLVNRKALTEEVAAWKAKIGINSQAATEA